MNTEIKTKPTTSAAIKWFSLVVFCLIQIGTSSDNSVLSNATSSLMQSFHTSVTAIQIANTIYPLIAGAFMIVFGVLGLIWGWKKLLQLGLLLLIAAETVAFLSPNMFVLSYVARILAGLGASMSIPAILGLIASIYNKKEQFIAFGAIAAASGIAAAVGPIVGGWLIVVHGWRFTFLSLAIIFAITFIGSIFVKGTSKPSKIPKFDFIGAILIVVSLLLGIYGLLQINQWGFISPNHAPFTLLGLSPCPFFIIASMIIFWFFVNWENHEEKKGKTVLLPKIFMQTAQVRAGLYMTALTFLILGGFTFVIVTFLQIVTSYNAIQTGFVLVTYAIGMVLFSIGIPIFNKHPSPRQICRMGIITSVISCCFLAYGLQTSATNPWLLVGLFIAGAGSGLIASQASVVITTAIPTNYAEQSGGIQGTMRNLGQAIGIVLLGVVLIANLTHSVKLKTKITPYLDAPLKHKVELIKNVNFISNKQVRHLLVKQNISKKEQNELITINEQSRLVAARISILFLGMIILLFILLTNGLPKTLLANNKYEDETEKQREHPK